MKYSSVTQKGQVTIPKEMRDKLLIKKDSQVRFELADGHIKIFPPGPSIFELAGTFKVPKNRPVMKAREYMEKHYADDSNQK